MALVDERGRLMGRFNLVDALVIVFLIALIPLGYGAYLLFTPPAPMLTAVEPAQIAQADVQHLTIRGQNLRPYMRVSFNDHQARNFLFSDVDRAEVDVDKLPSGTYDVVLYDQAQERFRLPKALTVGPPPTPVTVARVVGSFANLDAARAAAIKAGQKTSVGEVIAVGRPLPESTRVFSASRLLEIPVAAAVRLPAIMLMPCTVRLSQGRPECAVGDVGLQGSVFVIVPLEGGALPFQVDEVMGTQPFQEIGARVRFTAAPESLSYIRVGDVDRGPWVNEFAAGARITAVDAITRRADGSATRDVRLQLQAQRGTSSWIYAAIPLRVGGELVFYTPRYNFVGTVIEMTTLPDER